MKKHYYYIIGYNKNKAPQKTLTFNYTEMNNYSVYTKESTIFICMKNNAFNVI